MLKFLFYQRDTHKLSKFLCNVLMLAMKTVVALVCPELH